jgi:hypothetical protein
MAQVDRPTQLAPVPNYVDALRMSQNDIIYSAKALGMGNAFATLGSEYTAVLMNPATLGLIDSTTFSFSTNFRAFTNNTTYLSNTSDFSTNSSKLSQFGMAAPLTFASRDVVIALGFTQSKDFNHSLKATGFNAQPTSLIQTLTGLNSAIPSDLRLSYATYDTSGQFLGDQTVINGNLTESAYVLDYGGLTNFSFGLTLKVFEGVMVGASANYNGGTYTSDREFYETDTRDFYGASVLTDPSDPSTADFQEFYAHDVRETEYRGFDMRFGLLFKLWDFVSAGGAVKVPLPTTITETRYLNGTSTFGGGTQFFFSDPTRQTRQTVQLPFELTLGAAVNLWIIRATAQATYIDYTQMQYSDGLPLNQITLANKDIKDVFRPVINFNGGAEVDIPFTGISARAGFMWVPSPYESDRPDWESDEPIPFDRKYLTAGVGVNFSDMLAFDVGYTVGWWDQIRSNYGIETENVRQEIIVHNVILTTRFVF